MEKVNITECITFCDIYILKVNVLFLKIKNAVKDKLQINDFKIWKMLLNKQLNSTYLRNIVYSYIYFVYKKTF